MIPAIGVMIGGYIFIRLLSLATRKGERAESTLVTVLCFLWMLGTAAICAILVLQSVLGAKIPSIQ